MEDYWEHLPLLIILIKRKNNHPIDGIGIWNRHS